VGLPIFYSYPKSIILITASFFLLSSNLSAKTEKECFEKVSREIFKFNQGFDKAILKPIAAGYNKLPDPIKKGTGNFTSNIGTLLTVPNHLLQGQWKLAGESSVSFLINTTIGILGIFDVAEKIGFSEYEKEDYGQTLGKWGVGAGCYVVLPVLGPSTIRDTAGSFINVLGGDPYYNTSTHGNNEYLSNSVYMTSKVISGIDFRAKNLESIDNLEKNSMDFYASVKSLYLQDRQQKIKNSNPTIEIMYEGDWEEVETQ
jgi:phospholipid-binding lipoprotein MlaA